MSRTIKYLNLLVMSTFLVGQVQYAYSSYFCTMVQQPITVAAASEMSSMVYQPQDDCSGCRDVATVDQGAQIIEGNCVRVTLSQKKTVDNFADWTKFHTQSITSVNFLSTALSLQPPVSNVLLPTHPVHSPSLDLPTMNGNLRF